MNLSRRLFIGRVSSASAIGLSASVPALADAVQIEENAALLDLAPLCDEIDAECARIDANRLAARARYEALAPAVPACLVLSDRFNMSRKFVWCGEPEQDCEGKRIYEANGHSHRLIANSYNLASQFPWLKETEAHPDETGLTVELRSMYSHAKQYEADIEHARQVSGIEDALCEASGSYSNASRYATTVGALEARTWLGVAIKARALDLAARWSWEGPYSNGSYYGTLAKSDVMRDVLRIAKGGVL